MQFDSINHGHTFDMGSKRFWQNNLPCWFSDQPSFFYAPGKPLAEIIAVNGIETVDASIEDIARRGDKSGGSNWVFGATLSPKRPFDLFTFCPFVVAPQR